MAAAQNKTELVISAIDKASATLTQIGDRMEGLLKPAGDLHKALGKLYDATGLGAVKSAVSSLSKSMVGLATSTVGIAGVYSGTIGEIVHFGLAAAETADKVGDLAEKYQIHANSLQVYAALVEEDGGTMEDAAAAIGKLKKAMNEATHGGTEQAAAFAGVGITLAQLKGMKPEEVMERMATAFKGSDKDLSKQAVLLELMGKNGQIMMGTLNRGADGIRQKFQEMGADGRLFTDEQLQQADEFDKVWKRVQGTFDGLKTMLGLELAQKLQPMFENIQKWTVANRALIESKFDKFLEKLPQIINVGIEMFTGLWAVVQTLTALFKAANSVFGSTGTTLLMLSALISPVLLACGQLAWAVGLVAVKMVAFAWQMPVVGTALQAIWATMMANPIGLLIAAVIGLGIIIYKNWDGIVAYVSGAWDRIKAVFSQGFFSGIIQVWLEQWQALGNGILGIIKTITPSVLMPDALKNFNFSFATARAAAITGDQSPAGAAAAGQPARPGVGMTAAQAAVSKTEVGGTLRIQIEGAPAKVTELKKSGSAMDIDVSSGLTMMGT